MTTVPTLGELLEQVREEHNYNYDQAYAYLASAFFTLADDEDIVRVSESIGLYRKVK